ncbi:MAG TPA: hypothetical protein VMA09_15065 [Candidatus Binataceae bacterium]|nr:hypothetical protein [Candidatus Binataceae bacterium]
MAMTFGAASCGGSSNSFFFLGDGVWVADQVAAQVDEFTSGQLGVGTKNTPPRKIITNTTGTVAPTFTAPQDTLFDSNKNLWVIDGGDQMDDGTALVFEFTSKQLSSPGGTLNLTPTQFITTDDFVFPQFAVFDSEGNLWVSDTGANEIFEFSAAQLAGPPGNVTPTLTLTDDDEFDMPLGMAFDSSGDLWVANNGSTPGNGFGLLEFDAATLAASTGPITSDANFASVTTGQGTDSLNAPWGLSFDGNGDLFVTNEQPDFAPSAEPTSDALQAQAAPAATPTIGQGTVVEFSAAQIAAATTGAAPTPVAAIVPHAVGGTASLDDPNGVSVDTKLNFLIVANDGGDAESPSLSRYNLSAIGAGGQLVPNSFVSGANTTLAAPTGLIVGPAH